MPNSVPAPANSNSSTAAVTSPMVNSTVPATQSPPIARYLTHYERYNGSIGQGENKTTHTAEVRLDGTTLELAVVKAFSFDDKGWINEAVAWTLGRSIGLAVPPRAALLVASPDELDASSDPELVTARQTCGASGRPVIFWCASRLNIKPPHLMLTANWEEVMLRGSAGQALAAFDAWIGNGDRIADNAPYWTTRGLIAAIDHERLAFNQNWILAPLQHLDRTAMAETKLLARLHKAQSTNRFKPKQAKETVSALQVMSSGHAAHLSKVRADLERELLVNVSPVASANLLHFLEERASAIYISDRLGTVL